MKVPRFDIFSEPALTEGNQKVAANQSKPLSPLFFPFVSKIAALCHILAANWPGN